MDDFLLVFSCSLVLTCFLFLIVAVVLALLDLLLPVPLLAFDTVLASENASEFWKFWYFDKTGAGLIFLNVHLKVSFILYAFIQIRQSLLFISSQDFESSGKSEKIRFFLKAVCISEK